MYKLFNAHIGVLLDSFGSHTTNNMEKFIDQEVKKNTNLIFFLILIAIYIYI